MVLSGGFGKDSGALAAKGVPETGHHAQRLVDLGADVSRAIVESRAING